MTQVPAAVRRDPPPPGSSYREILRSSALIGGASALTIAIGIVRTKVIAVLLGPAGLGLMGALNALLDLTRTVAIFGINGSGVRQIADANASGDGHRIARTVTVLRRVILVLGVVGTALVFALAGPLSELTFETAAHAGAIAMLAPAVFFKLAADGSLTLIQGMRRIGDLARVNVYSALLGTPASIALIAVWGVQGVAPALVAMAAAAAFVSWWYERKVQTQKVSMTLRETGRETQELLRLGIAFLASALLTTGAGYVVRLIVIHEISLEAAGYYQAAWTLSSLYIGIVLQAMSSDFYPRLVSSIHDHPAANRIVNEQAHVSLLLSSTGVLATTCLAPWVIHAFYSPQFLAATEALRWMCLGMALRMVSFPVGYIVVAKGSRKVFIAAEVAWTIFNVAASWICVKYFGLRGVGIAFFASYVFHIAMIYPIARKMTGFRWTRDNLRMMVVNLGPIGIVFALFYLLPEPMAMALGMAVCAVSAWLSWRALTRLGGLPMLPERLRRLVKPAQHNASKPDAAP